MSQSSFGTRFLEDLTVLHHIAGFKESVQENIEVGNGSAFAWNRYSRGKREAFCPISMLLGIRTSRYMDNLVRTIRYGRFGTRTIHYRTVRYKTVRYMDSSVHITFHLA